MPATPERIIPLDWPSHNTIGKRMNARGEWEHVARHCYRCGAPEAARYKVSEDWLCPPCHVQSSIAPHATMIEIKQTIPASAGES